MGQVALLNAMESYSSRLAQKVERRGSRSGIRTGSDGDRVTVGKKKLRVHCQPLLCTKSLISCLLRVISGSYGSES